MLKEEKDVEEEEKEDCRRGGVGGVEGRQADVEEG